MGIPSDPRHWRVGLIVAVAVPITYGLTLMVNFLLGYTINRVTLFALILTLGLPVRLRVVIPAVENAVGGAAFRPQDILPSRKGLTVEIGKARQNAGSCLRARNWQRASVGCLRTGRKARSISWSRLTKLFHPVSHSSTS